MGLITETNEEYYAGEKVFLVLDGASSGPLATTFDTELQLTTSTQNSNFRVEYSEDVGVTWKDYTGVVSLSTTKTANDTVNLTPVISAGPGFDTLIRVVLMIPAVWNNYGGYSYTSLNDIVNNFLVGYIGHGKLIPSAKRTDVIFHAKRGLQEFSYDTLKSIKSQELHVPPSLSVIMPQDYVNYVRMSWIDAYGIKHIIYPSDNLTSAPYTVPLQDASSSGEFIFDNFGENTEGTSLTMEKWEKLQQWQLSGGYNDYLNGAFNYYGQDYMYGRQYRGMRYGLLPETTQINGYFTINEREGKFSFSSDMSGKLIILEYISDGLGYDLDMKVPKMAEEAMYMHIAYSILATRPNIPEYIVQRYKKDRRATLRNAKIRLSEIKLDQIVRIMRNKSKWIKH
jgi:hypothetical protein